MQREETEAQLRQQRRQNNVGDDEYPSDHEGGNRQASGQGGSSNGKDVDSEHGRHVHNGEHVAGNLRGQDGGC
jgi:hypothetical protein